MMKIINKVTLRHMLLNKKRTLVTIIGVIISVAMITAVSTFAASMFDFIDVYKRQHYNSGQDDTTQRYHKLLDFFLLT